MDHPEAWGTASYGTNVHGLLSFMILFFGCCIVGFVLMMRSRSTANAQRTMA
jgi:hypothetical protein